MTVSLLKRLGFAAAGACLALAASCGSFSLNPFEGPKPQPVASADPVTVKPSNIARLPRPRLGDDFYGHVNNEWLSTYQLPPDKASYGAAEELGEFSDQQVRAMIEGIAARKPAPGSLEQKIADLYMAALDEKGIEARGIDPIRPHLERIRAARTIDDVVKLMGVVGYNAPISVSVNATPANPNENAVWVSQAGLGMPHRGYYLEVDLKSMSLQLAYRRYVAKVLSLLGYPDPEDGAQRIYNLEYRIAQAHTDEDRSISAAETMKPMDHDQLMEFAPGFDWDTFLDAAGFPAVDRFVVTDQTAVPAIALLLHKIPIDDWKLWMEFHFASDYADYLPRDYADARFEFYSHQLSGVDQKPERWKFAVDVVNGMLGDGVAELYVKRYFPPGNKARIDAMLVNIRSAFAARIRSLDWMDGPTRVAALDKLAHLQGMIAYPDSWRDYSGLSIKPGKLFEGLYSTFEFEWRGQQDDLASPVDRRRWPTPAHVVNAFYNPLGNTFVLPAGILQPPFFDPEGDDAVNYGGIGAVIGHEMSHGFDDQGRQFDRDGRTINWWTELTDERFIAKSNALIDQYNAYCPYFGACVNGLGTLGENIGDLAGLEIAYAAYHLSLNGAEAPIIGGLTGDQRFFIAYAQTYRDKMREEFGRAMLEGDSHAPSRYRVNGVVRNMDTWYAAFAVKPGDKLYLPPDERVKIW